MVGGWVGCWVIWLVDWPVNWSLVAVGFVVKWQDVNILVCSSLIVMEDVCECLCLCLSKGSIHWEPMSPCPQAVLNIPGSTAHSSALLCRSQRT